jgi:hypothetical protein
MRFIVLFLFFQTPIVFALDGLEFVNCLEKAINESIQDFRAEEAKDPKNTRFEVERLCSNLSKKDYQKLKNLFVEIDETSGKEVPFDKEDMSLIEIKELGDFLGDYISCYAPYSDGEDFVDRIVNRVSGTRNKYLIENALSLITKEKSPKDSKKLLGDSDLSFCN